MRLATRASALLAALLAWGAPALADSPPPDLIPPGMGKPPPPIHDPFAAPPGSLRPPAGKVEGATESDAALAATSAKFNAYVAFMNRTLRAVDSLNRYKSWVNMRTGPTGRERVVYGLYSVYDVKTERAQAETALTAIPQLPDLDAAMRAYIAANETLAPVLNKASGYYDRADYKLDHMEGGKALHGQIVPAGEAFLAARARLETVMRVEKGQFDRIRLATIEKREGRNTKWHVANVMMNAKQTLDALETGKRGTIDMPVFEADMVGLGDAVKALDDYNAEHPGVFSAFDVFPDQFLGGLRSVQQRLERTHGDLARSAGFEMQMVLSNYNTMVTTAQTATMFGK